MAARRQWRLQPPGSYSVPAGALAVTTSTGLVSALNGSSPRDIVLADGVYDLPAGQHFVDANGSHLYAQHVGGAVLTAGLEVGGNWSSGGAIVRGLAFNVSDPSKTFQNADIDVWGNAGQNLQVLDSTLDGNWVVGAGVQAYQPLGLVTQRLVITHFTDAGLYVSTNTPVAYGASTPAAMLISDISVDGVSRPVPGSSHGTAEAGLWIGQPIADGVHRIKVRNVAISGIETCNNAFDTTFTDLDIDMSGPHAAVGVGIYLEHFSRHLTFNTFTITGSQFGFTAEWDDGTPGNAAAHFTTIENGTIDTTGWALGGPSIGIELDVGTETTTITNVTFKNQTFAAIDTYHTIGTNTFTGNTFQLAASTPQLSADHR